ncbi:hypothetical protein [Chryseobacterium ginsenosidimutans]
MDTIGILGAVNIGRAVASQLLVNGFQVLISVTVNKNGSILI